MIKEKYTLNIYKKIIYPIINMEIKSAHLFFLDGTLSFGNCISNNILWYHFMVMIWFFTDPADFIFIFFLSWLLMSLDKTILIYKFTFLLWKTMPLCKLVYWNQFFRIRLLHPVCLFQLYSKNIRNMLLKVIT